jgi:hypothetical protein
LKTKLLKIIFNNFDDILTFATSVGEKSLVPLGIPVLMPLLLLILGLLFRMEDSIDLRL